MNKVYVVWECYDEYEMVSIHKTEAGARKALLDYLVYNVQYSPTDWEEYADINGYNSVDEFRQAILDSNMYDVSFYVMVEEVALED